MHQQVEKESWIMDITCVTLPVAWVTSRLLQGPTTSTGISCVTWGDEEALGR